MLGAGCGRPPYPLPPSRRLPETERPGATSTDAGDAARVREIERQCRVRLSGETAEASLAALDRVREVLGTGCDLSTVEHDPLHWLLRCRSDALFESGAYRLTGRDITCIEHGGARASPWVCVGAVLRDLLGGGEEPGNKGNQGDKGETHGALASLELAVLGHVDRQLLRPGSTAHACRELHEALGFAPRGRWEAVSEDALDEERLYANHQLAWCRAASIAEELRRGLEGGLEGTDLAFSLLPPGVPVGDERGGEQKRKSEIRPRLQLAVLGMGTSWLASQPSGHCPGDDAGERVDCPEARRVDLLMRFTPRVEARRDVCTEQAPDAKGALWCLQDCIERLALGASGGAGIAAASAPLFGEGSDARDALPVGWTLHRLPALEGRRLALARVCDVLGVAPAQCEVR